MRPSNASKKPQILNPHLRSDPPIRQSDVTLQQLLVQPQMTQGKTVWPFYPKQALTERCSAKGPLGAYLPPNRALLSQRRLSTHTLPQLPPDRPLKAARAKPLANRALPSKRRRSGILKFSNINSQNRTLSCFEVGPIEECQPKAVHPMDLALILG